MNKFIKIFGFFSCGIFLFWLLFELILISAPAFLAFLREPKIFLGSKKDSLKIYCIGDSFTYGMGMAYDKSYPFLLQEKLAKTYPNKNIEVFNLGKPSHGLSYVYYTLKEIHENRKDLNAIFLVLGGWNVSDYDFARLDKNQSQKISDRIKLFLNNFRTFRFIKSYYLFKKLYYPYGNEDYVPPFWAKTNYDFGKYQEIDLDYLDKIANYAKNNNLDLIFLNYPQNPPPQNPYTDLEVNHFMFSQQKISKDDYIIEDRKENEIAVNSIIRRVAEKHNLPWLDINKDFENSNQKTEELFLPEDGYHPSAKGQEIISETVLDYLSSSKKW